MGFVVGLALGASGSRGQAVTCPQETWIGSDANDTKYDSSDGVAEDNRWYGGPGDDYLRTEACGDYTVTGQTGADDIGGGAGNDNLWGEQAADRLHGQRGSDGIRGGSGNDYMNDAEGPATGDPTDYDFVYGESDNDTIDVQDGDTGDLADGGAGRDTCRVDVTSERAACE